MKCNTKSKGQSEMDNPENYKFENVSCYYCGSNKNKEFLKAREDYTGKPGLFKFVKCSE